MPSKVETDQELRERLLYVTGDGPAWIDRIQRATGPRLDEIATSVNLKRRKK